MPVYSYECECCGSREEIFLRLSEYQSEQICSNCNHTLTKILVPTMISVDYQGYSCPVTGNWIEGKKAHEENLKKHGCRIFESGETRGMRERREAEEATFDKKIEESVERYVGNLSTSQTERLAKEVASGVNIEITRE